MSMSSFEQQRRSTRHEMRIIDAVLEHMPSAASNIEDISKSIRPIIQGLVHHEPPTPDLTSKALRKSMHFLNAELDEYREELSSLRVQLSSKSSQLKDMTGERDRCRKALEEAHACVSDYHKKLSTMERTVGHALVSRGELKEATTKLDEAKSLNQQFKETLAAADIRVETMEETIAEQKERIHFLEQQVESEKEKVSSCSYDRLQHSRRAEKLESELDEAQTRLTDVERLRDVARDEAGEVGRQHAETLAALSDLITIQKRSDTERGSLEISLREQQTTISRHEATIEGLRAQLEAARHAPLRSAADIACGGVRFGAAAHSGAAQAAGRAAAALAEALPGLQAALQEEMRTGALRDCCSDGSPGEVAGRGVQAGGGRAGSAGHQAAATDLARSADSLRQLKQILDRAGMFHEVDDPQQTLYGSLRDLWAALEVRLAEALPEVVALVGLARDGAREARHRQDHLRDALRDTHDALARSTAERNRAKQATVDLQDQLDSEQRQMADEVGAAQSAARAAALRREDDLREARARAADLDTVLTQERADAQRQRDEHEHQVHVLQVEMRARFAMLRDSYQHQLDTLHLQVADIEATCKLPRLPRIGDGLAAACATQGQPPAPGAPRLQPAADTSGSPRWDDGDPGTANPEETPQHSRRGKCNGRGELDAFKDDDGSGGGWHGQGLWRAEAAPRDSRYLQSVESAQGSCEVPRSAQAQWPPSGLQRPQACSYSPSPRKPAGNPLLADALEPVCDTPPHHGHHAHEAPAAAKPLDRGFSAPPRPATSRGRHMQPLHMHEMQVPAQAGRGLDEYDDHAFVSALADHVRGHARAGEQVPTRPSQHPGSTGDEIFGILVEEPLPREPLPREPLPDTSHLGAARAPRQVEERQARAYGSPHGDAFPRVLADSGAAAPHGAAWHASNQNHRRSAATDVAALQRPTPGSSPGTPHSSLSWGIPMQDPWRSGPQHPQHPQTARPSRGIGDAGLASPEAILLATQHEGREGQARPQSARPSDHWADVRVPSANTPGALQPRRRPSSTPGPRAGTPGTARRTPCRRDGPRAAATPSPAPPSHTESAVLAALKKSGLLERLGNGGAADAPSSAKRKKTVKTTKATRGRSRTPKQASLWHL